MEKKSEDYIEGFLQGIILATTHWADISKDDVIKYMIQHLETKK